MRKADVKLETGEATVVYDDAKQTADKLAAAIAKLGYKASVVSVMSVTGVPHGEGAVPAVK